MKRSASAILLATAMGCASAVTLPSVDGLFHTMAISVRPGQHAQFVAGDNIAGYFEGYTQSYDKGAGYVLRSGSFFRNYMSYTEGRQNQRSGAHEEVLPYGHAVHFTDGVQEEMALIPGRQAIAMRVRSPHAAALALRPLLSDGVKLEVVDKQTVAADLGAAGWLLLAADQPVTLGADGRLTATRPAMSLTLVALFGKKDELPMARRLASRQPIELARRLHYQRLTRSWLATSDASYNKALLWAEAASQLFVVEEFGKGIWAGLPWFRDNWGRDTFIALPGTLLVSGRFDDAKAVLMNFARYQNLKDDQNYGRIPNRVAVGDIIYNTVDGTPWMLREALEYIRYTGDRAFAADMLRLSHAYFDGAFRHYMDQQYLLTHDGADTWMDARIDGKAPWSNRGSRAVEIQALWYTTLRTGAELARQAGDTESAEKWEATAKAAQQSFLSLFWDGSTMADRLRPDGSRDVKVRPNQLMLLSIPLDDFVPLEVQAKVLKNAVGALLYPYGVASLSQDDPYFHPRHENPAFHHKDAAYHQGTVWGWNAGFTVTGLNKFGQQDLAWSLSQNLGQQILGLGTLGNMSELLDALPHEGGKLKPSGTFAQSWSVAEYARNAYQDYLGFHPDLLADTLIFQPAIPTAWTHFDAVLPYGREQIEIEYKREGKVQRWTLLQAKGAPHLVQFKVLAADGSRRGLRFTSQPGKRMTLELREASATLDGQALTTELLQASYAKEIGMLHFRQPAVYKTETFPMLQGRDVLKGIVEREEYR